MKKFIISGLLILSLILPIAVKAENTNLEEMTTSLLQKIEQLKQQIVQLQTQVIALEKQVQEVIQFTKTLRKGAQDEEVKKLQEFLKQDPEVYPEGLVTGYYGPLTEKAVKKFQEKNAEDVLKPLGLSEGTGVVGAKTLEKMNKVLEEAGKSGTVPPGLLKKEEEKKVTICHIPDGNVNKKQTINISKSALEAHLAHGDTVGACPSSLPSQPATSVPATIYNITVVSPNGGETWTTGSLQYIKWSSNIPAIHNIITIRLRDSANAEHDLLSNTPNDSIEQITVPADLAAGAYLLEIKTVFENQTVIDKSDATFNITAPASAPTLYLPDLEVFSLMTGHVYVNESNTISAGFKNVGTAALSQNFVIKYYVDGIYAGEKEQTYPNGASLAPTTSGGSNSGGPALNYTFTTAGNHEVKAVLDANDAVSEIYEQNNTLTRTINIITPSQSLADLEPVYMYPSHHYANQSNKIYVRLVNRGAVVAPQGFTVKLYVDGNYANEQTAGDLLPSNGTTIAIPYTFAGIGTHEVKVVVDDANSVVESSDENNTFTQTMAMR